MKNKWILFIVVISLFFVCAETRFSTISAKGEAFAGSSGAASGRYAGLEEEDIPVDGFMAEYFVNLRTNFANNPAFFCVYVSLSMMLSYYDTWWNDNIIEEIYDEPGSFDDSPGIYSDFPADVDDLQEYLDAQGEYDFMFQLFSNENELRALYDDDIKNIFLPGVIACGLDNIQKGELFSPHNVDVEKIPDYLDNNHPVMISDGHHALVVFAYDGDRNVFFAHNGYADDSGNPRLVTVSASGVRCAFALNPTTENTHICSNNYDGDICPCYYYDEHPHQQEHTFLYDNDSHFEYCGETLIKTETHGFTVVPVDDEEHGIFCECGYSVTEYHWEHDPDILGISYEQHLAECIICRREWLEEHFPFYYEEFSENNYRILCYCGYPLYFTDELPPDVGPYPC